MKRILLSLVCCSSLLITAPLVQSVELTGPSSEIPVIESYGPISSTETLWAISNKLRPNNSVSVYQTLVAIYKLNPYAFTDGDVNKIIPNSVLNVPSVEFIAKQTNAEAYRLLKPKKPVAKTPPKVTPKAVVEEPKQQVEQVQPKVVEPKVVGVDPAIVEQLKSELADRDLALTNTENQIAEQEKELLVLNEQILSVTESNQALKIKLQPLMDQIAALNEQVEQDVALQNELQALIDEYKKQIDAFEEPPFSGEGIINEILRGITSSVLALLLTILTPLLLLMALFVLYLRIKSKQELALQEQEMAESTAIHMEESGKFDALLTDDLEETEAVSDEIDFTQQPTASSAEQTPEPEMPAPEQPEQMLEVESDDIGEVELDVVEESDDVVNLDDINVPEKEEFEELVASEDDPFGIEALVDEENLLIEDDEGGEPDSLISESEESVELSAADLGDTSDADQADLDLAAEWEAQLAAGDEQEVVDLDSLAEQSADEQEAINLDEGFEPEPVEQDVVDLEATAEEETEPTKKSDQEQVTAELESAHEETVDLQQDEVSEQPLAEETETLEDASPETISDVVESTEIESQQVEESGANLDQLDSELNEIAEIETDKQVEELDVEDISEFENIDISSLKSVDDSLSELDAELEQQAKQGVTEDVDFEQDLLAQQLSEKAFNEDVPLPKVDSDEQEGFIDIETLLEDTDQKELGEEAFDLEMGLDEFPDVVHAENEYENDENGIANQLDLARAYLEIDEKQGAKDILTALLETANEEQLPEVKKLLDRID